MPAEVERLPNVSNKVRILVVEDDVIQRRGLVEPLLQTGDFDIEEAADGAGALEAVAEQQPDVIILDVELAGSVNGFDVARKIVGERRPCSIIILTNRGEDDDMAEGLNAGAVTYISKPVKLRVLLAQIKSLVNAGTIQRQNAILIGEFTLFPVSRKLVGRKRDSGEEVEMQLTDMQARVLQHLHVNREGFVPVERLLTEVWNYAPNVDTHTVQSHIHRIRDMLRSNGFREELIETRRNAGYRLSG
ncbi:MAG: response regulator transcription factor [Rhodobacteraceae bacterium]|nr:response regulator transcription factor [Paracoccaceae bacterium]